jgi:hypothetical protein
MFLFVCIFTCARCVCGGKSRVLLQLFKTELAPRFFFCGKKITTFLQFPFFAKNGLNRCRFAITTKEAGTLPGWPRLAPLLPPT